jgi:peptide-methionine (S)-S-oxide reductase
MKWIPITALISLTWLSCKPQTSNTQKVHTDMQKNDSSAVAIFGGGCFWCTEAVFQQINGVIKVESGYAGGQVKNPSYREICTGTTGHAEVIKIFYDPKQITFAELVYVHFRTHDPTTLNRQGADQGTQYRSVVFYQNEAEKDAAFQVKRETEDARVWQNPIVTEITAFTNYYPAETYHQNYYNQNRSQGYCVYVIDPKMEKLRKDLKDKLKE